MKVTVWTVSLLALAVLGLGMVTASPAWSQGDSDDVLVAEGTVVEYLEGEKITVRVPGEQEGDEEDVTFAITEDTETYGEIAVGAKVEVEYREKGVALFVGTLEQDS